MCNDQNQKKDNVVLFPGLVLKLVDKGMASLKAKKFEEALRFFQEALELEPNHSKGRFGEVLSYIELGMLEEAAEKSKEMLHEDIGNYYEILQVHISILFQLSNYEEVVIMLEAVLSEEQLPSNVAESFYQWLHFSRQMIGDGINLEFEQPPHLEEQEPPQELLHLLENEDRTKQWKAIQLLSKSKHPIVITALKKFLVDDHDLILKSVVLQLLSDLQINEPIEISKQGQTVTVVPTNVKNVYTQEFGQQVEKRIIAELEHDNPSLLETVLHLWWHYLFAVYPLIPIPEDERLWAAAVHIVGLEGQGFDFDELEIANRYQVSVFEMLEKSNEISDIEQNVFQDVQMNNLGR
ncbi:tetratricopeptide repeat protein [Bacillus alkalicellulosilyticus]|uniref:tetratricopeptide repeat protein n=1 Tax=Alkalihalobacterium alkalicellulosilyticum TaxID=1912214 RepID=UPI0009989613|nr:tetratricopeptide repeat protein [Bacillus alkalicellulosilyticus]